MTPSKIADPLLPEQIAKIRAARARIYSLPSHADDYPTAYEIEDANAALDELLLDHLDEILSAAERGIAAGEEVERLKGEMAEWQAKARKMGQDQYEHPWTVNEAAQWRMRAEKAEADLAASNARVGEERREALEEAAAAILSNTLEWPPTRSEMAEVVSALLTPTHPETERE